MRLEMRGNEWRGKNSSRLQGAIGVVGNVSTQCISSGAGDRALVVVLCGRHPFRSFLIGKKPCRGISKTGTTENRVGDLGTHELVLSWVR